MSPGPAGAPLDVLVIGGGLAGPAMGYHLAQRGLSFQIADAGAGIGQTWRSRRDSLRLFKPGRMTTCRATSCHVARALSGCAMTRARRLAGDRRSHRQTDWRFR